MTLTVQVHGSHGEGYPVVAVLVEVETRQRPILAPSGLPRELDLVKDVVIATRIDQVIGFG